MRLHSPITWTACSIIAYQPYEICFLFFINSLGVWDEKNNATDSRCFCGIYFNDNDMENYWLSEHNNNFLPSTECNLESIMLHLFISQESQLFLPFLKRPEKIMHNYELATLYNLYMLNMWIFSYQEFITIAFVWGEVPVRIYIWQRTWYWKLLKQLIE